MEADLITVVVPVYNVEKCLGRCIDSIIKQTYNNIEIILVDDGSTDSSGKICDSYSNQDNRIKVIHKQNGGLSDARNKGIDIAKGKYITFVDSDDFIALDMISFLYESIKKNNADISTCSGIMFWDGDELKVYNENTEQVYDGKEALEKYLYQKKITNSAWGKLYNISLFKKIRYPNGKLCEDLGTTYMLLGEANKVVINTCKKYYYYQRENSIMHKNVDDRRMITMEFSDDIIDYVSNNYPTLVMAAKNKKFSEAVYLLKDIRICKENKKYIDFLFEIIRNNRREVLKDKKSKYSNRIYALCSYFGKHVVKTATCTVNCIRKIRK